jgi:hypothetical protein
MLSGSPPVGGQPVDRGLRMLYMVSDGIVGHFATV